VPSAPKTAPDDLPGAYLDLLESALLGATNGEVRIHVPVSPRQGSLPRRVLQKQLLKRGQTVLSHVVRFHPDDDPTGRRNAYELPPGIKTMIGQRRLHHLRGCVEDVLANKVKGDLIETGVWRGGATILMRGVLKAHGVTDRSVVVADSFEGLPPPNADEYPADAGLDFSTHEVLAVSQEQVAENFRTFGLLDDQVQFVKGWFRDTMPGLRDRQWSVLRLDGDLYESTMDVLTNLYPQLSPGGWLIIDDYSIPACAKAVHDYRDANGITEEIEVIDDDGICWKKAKPRRTVRRQAGSATTK
jgi:hypothetical protein